MSQNEKMEKTNCQNCTYTKLDSMETDSDVYKREDELKLLIDPQTPKKVVKKIKKKKRVLSTLDILISIFIVTPSVVGCWRGIWQIMDTYAVYFPAWESFCLGMAIHMVLALSQDVFHEVVVEQEPKNPVMRIFACLLMKFYTTTFNVISNMVWRAGWILFDRYCGLQSSEDGQAIGEGSSSAIWFTIVCIMLLFCLKGLKNTMSPPFSIALDCKDEVFLFSTRFIYKGAYVAAVLIMKRTQFPKTISSAEKLVASPSMQIASVQKLNPRPFGTNTFGVSPQQFTLTTTTPIPTTIRAPSLNYPQLSNYRSNYHPKSIQEILSYINKHGSYDMEMQEGSKERQSTNDGSSPVHNSVVGVVSSDPFYDYKPSDPSEINLMATASFRFAPPAWKNFRKLYQEHGPNTQVDTSNIEEIVRNFAKPFVVNLNIYPMRQRYPGPVNRYDDRLFSQRTQGSAPYNYHADPRGYFGDKANKITIRLNVFPETVRANLNQQDQHAESTVNKVKFI